MREEIRYIANDETVFYDEDECRNYEINTEFEKHKNSIIFLNEKGENITERGLVCCLDESYFLQVKTMEALCFLKEQFDDFGIEGPWNYNKCDEKVGAYYYDDGWHDFEAKIKEVKEKCELFGYDWDSV